MSEPMRQQLVQLSEKSKRQLDDLVRWEERQISVIIRRLIDQEHRQARNERLGARARRRNLAGRRI
jgi:hypothetical protein